MNNYIVYKHTSPSKKCYIGITCRKPERRWGKGNGYKTQILFYRAIKKYGWDNIKHEILYSNLTEEEAKSKEMELIKHYKELNLSYNITDGGDGTLGFHPSKETREKMSIAHSNISEETREKLRLARLGYHHSEETKEKIRQSLKGRIPSEQCRAAQLLACKGVKRDEESKRKSAEGHKKPIIQIDKDTNIIIKEWKSAIDVMRELGIDSSSIAKCCRGKKKTAGGFKWKYKKRLWQ